MAWASGNRESPHSAARGKISGTFVLPEHFAELAMATGWAQDGAVQDQIDATVKDGIERARSQLPRGPSLKKCEECGATIPKARRDALPGVRLCVPCQEEHDADQGHHAGYNRRGSKDSQLR
jgi:phage/conjugal plasmid C-4 type zinc finger TraR family protein